MAEQPSQRHDWLAYLPDRLWYCLGCGIRVAMGYARTIKNVCPNNARDFRPYWMVKEKK